MKRIVSFALVVLMLVAFCAGCADKSESSDRKTKPTTAQNPTGGSNPGESQPSTGPSGSEPQPSNPQPSEPAPSDPKPSEPQPSEPEPPVPPTPDVEPGRYTRDELESMNTKVNGWGLGPHTDAEGRPIDATRAQDKYGKYDAYYIMPSDGKIYLTFDEGYENGYTGKILDVLKEKNVKAVFFITMPYAKSEPELVQRMIDEGHVVGNHSVKHKSMPTLSIDKQIEEVMDLHEYVKEHFGYEMTLFRPPMGEFSEQSLAVLQNLGYKTIAWSFAYYDYDPANQPNPQKAFDKVVGAAHSGGIFLLHAVSETNTNILGDVIDAFRNQNFELALLG